MNRALSILPATGLALLCAAAPAAAQTAPLELRAPSPVATGVGFTVTGQGAAPATRLRIELRLAGRWRRLATAGADAGGRFERRLRPRRVRRRYVLRALAADGRASDPVVVRTRDVTLASVGDINLGNGPGLVIAQRGVRYPWTGVARELRRPDITFGNLECAVSTRGAPVPKQFNFRGRPAALRVLGGYAGFDVLNLANNHAGDYGSTALLDTARYVRRYGMTAVGAGGSLAAAARPRVVERLGLRVAFVGFSDILPASFFAGPNSPGHPGRHLPRHSQQRARRPAPGRRGDRHLPLGCRTCRPRERAPAGLCLRPPWPPARRPLSARTRTSSSRFGAAAASWWPSASATSCSARRPP